MLKLFLGKTNTTVTTLLILGLIAFLVFSFLKRDTIQFWGRRTLLASAWGLLICCTASTRDLYHLSVQNAIDGSASPGLFSVNSIQSYLGCIFAAVIVLSGILTLILHKQNIRELLFYTLSCGIIAKVAVIEISRIVIYLSNPSAWAF